MKALKNLKVFGFALAVVSTVIVIAGFVNYDSLKYVVLFGNEPGINDGKFPFGLFLVYLGLILVAISSVVWSLGYIKNPPKSTKSSVSALCMRIFSFTPAVCGLVILLGGLLADVDGKVLVALDMSLRTYTALLGAVILVVFGLIWYLGFSKSVEKTFVLMLGDTKSAKMLRDYRSELKKVVWLSKEETIKQTGVVLASLVSVAAVIGVLDFGFLKLIELLTDLI